MSFDPDQLTAREAAEALYLAAHMDAVDAEEAADVVVGGADRDQGEQSRQPEVAGEWTPPRQDRPRPSSTAAASLGRQPTWHPAGLEPAAAYSVPGAQVAFPTLAGEREIGRALRPFNQRVGSLTELELDEEATAERAAEDGLWLPVHLPAATRWLTIVLIIDTSVSMLVWRRAVAAFTSVLERQGAFRNVLTYWFDADKTDPVVLRSGVSGTRSLNVSELTQPQRVVLLLTDGLGMGWRSGSTDRLLAELGARLPVAVLHLLPEEAWYRTALTPVPARLRSDGAAVPNGRLQWNVAATGLYTDPPSDGSVLPVPVLALDADSLGWWARLVTGASDSWTDAQLTFAAAGRHAPATIPRDEAPPEAIERVLRFRANATPTAFKLATYLAAAPLELSLMETVQNAMLPDSGPAHLSEVLTGGLVRRTEEMHIPQAAGGTGLDFHKGVREELLAASLRRDTARVLRIVGERLGPRVEAFGQLTKVLTAPDTAQDPPVTAETAPLIRLQSTALRALSGPYLNPARRLTNALERLEVERADSVSGTPDIAPSAIKDIPMPEVTEQTPSRVLTPEETPAQTAEAYPDVTSAITTRPVSAERRPGDPPPIWGDVPPRNPNFIGREDLLDELHRRLQTGMTAVLPEALHGMGGVGKSQIAVEYVYRHTADYDLIWWVPSDGSTQVASAFVELAQQSGVAKTNEANIAVSAVREALRKGKPYRNWLLVFDNAESPDVVRPYFPPDGPGHILVTSRNPQWAAIAPRPLEVNVFQRGESKQLLHRRGPVLEDSDAERLAQVLGDLPLAIDQAAAWLAETGMPASDYLRLFEEKASELLGAVETTDYKLSVAAAWNVSLDRLREKHPAALQLLQVCSFFAPEPISRQLLSGVREAPVPPELLATLRDPIRLGRAIREINRYALARIDHRDNTIQLHRLVQAVLVGQMSSTQRDEMRHAAHVLLANGDPNNPAPPQEWQRYRELLPHVQASNAIECDDGWVRSLVLNTIQFLYWWGDHEAFRELAQRTVDVWTARSGAEDERTLNATQWLGRALRLLGYYGRARELDEQALARMRHTLGEEHDATNLMMNSVAADLRIQGNFEAARDLNRRAAEIAERVFGEDDPSTLVARHNLALSTRLCGDFRTALELDLATLDRRIQVLGERNRQTLNTLNGVGLDEIESGMYLAARKRQESTTNRCRVVLGDNNPLTILVIQTLAVARRRAGDHHGAYEMSEEALERFRSRYGKDDPQSVSAAANLAVDLRQTGELQGARNLGERTLQRYRATLGEDHPHTLASAVNHAVVLRQLGEVRTAHQMDDSAYEKLRTLLGREHPLTLTCATNLASDLAALGESQAAYDLGSETLELATRKLGEDHPSTLVCAANVALDLRALDRMEEAATLHDSTMERLREVLGKDHPATELATRYVRSDCDANPLPL